MQHCRGPTNRAGGANPPPPLARGMMKTLCFCFLVLDHLDANLLATLFSLCDMVSPPLHMSSRTWSISASSHTRNSRFVVIPCCRAGGRGGDVRGECGGRRGGGTHDNARHSQLLASVTIDFGISTNPGRRQFAGLSTAHSALHKNR